MTRAQNGPDEGCVLTINAGSSSIRFAVHEAGARARRVLAGKIDRIGSREASLVLAPAERQLDRRGGPRDDQRKGPVKTKPVAHSRFAAADHRAAIRSLLKWLEAQPLFGSIRAVGHRVVHGMEHSAPERITPKLLAELRRIAPYDPEHLPREIELIETLRRRHPRLPQVACFDTAFHRTMPRVAQLLPIPRRYLRQGVKRYGFHGLSCAYLMDELARLDPAAAKGRVILAHLGNGASLTAVRGGRSVDTSMGLTPVAGLVMGTRTGDLDPGVLAFLARRERMTPARFQRMVNHESGLLGVSGTSADMRDLLAREATDARAAEAVALFCYQARKWIGSFAAVLGGLDTLVFAGGIGENAPVVRARMCEGLGFLGLMLGRRRNASGAPLISTDASRVAVRVIHTDEELVIARSVSRLLSLAPSGKKQP